MTNALLYKAKRFAQDAHSAQVRKYTNRPYFEHCDAVAGLVALFSNNTATIAAAYLHDVVEDCGVALATISNEFSPEVAAYVHQVTKISTRADGNRAKRQHIELEHLGAASPEGKTIKLADIYDNCLDIVDHDPAFAKVYLVEKERQIEALKGGNMFLHNTVEEFVAMQANKLLDRMVPVMCATPVMSVEKL